MKNRIVQTLERLRRAVWTYKQPLTSVPSIIGAPVSDLFVWRKSNDWETFFELIDLPSLFSKEKKVGRSATFTFFDNKGELILHKSVNVEPFRRKTLALSEIIGSVESEYGTFCVFHNETPENISANGSHIAERGYLSYRYRKGPLRAYLHGNLDAVCQLPERKIQMLGGQSVLQREFHLQHLLTNPGQYELAMVNPTAIVQSITCQSLSLEGQVLKQEKIKINPKGCYFFNLEPSVIHNRQLVAIKSRMVMARPIIFRELNQVMDVVHG